MLLQGQDCEISIKNAETINSPNGSPTITDINIEKTLLIFRFSKRKISTLNPTATPAYNITGSK